MRKLKVALVHDYLLALGGAERVLVALHEIWPEAPVYLSLIDKKALGKDWPIFKNWDLRPSWFQKLPKASRLISPLRFLVPLIWESFDFSEYDLVISSSAMPIPRGIITGPDTVHICYCHTPPRFLYHYPEAGRLRKYWPVRVYSNLISHYLRLYDYIASQRVDYFIANSQEVASRISKFYRRQAAIIQPPVNLEVPKDEKVKSADFYLYASRLFSYKHPELAIRACQKLGRKLMVVGDGVLREEVEKMAAQSDGVVYLGRVSDKKLRQLYQECKAFIYPIEDEDFGIMPLEAATFGKPTIGYFSGGVKETIKGGETGVFFKELTVDSLVKAIKRFEKMEFSPQVCQAWAKQFSKDNFKKRIKEFVKKKIKEN